MKKIIFLSLFFILLLGSFNFVFAQERVEINFFYSKKCPYCQAEQKFLDKLAEKYPQVKINRYLYDDPTNQKILLDFCQQCNAERYVGLVPLTFVGKRFFLGFDNEEGVGKEIEDEVKNQLKGIKSPLAEKKINIPFFGEVSGKGYSLLAFSALLGSFDGFNVCSLGALVLILGLVLSLRSRMKVLIFGGVFILTTAIVYGLLIVLWYRIFSYFVPYLWLMELSIALLGIGGGVYFLRQFLRFKKEGPVCEIKEKGIMPKLSAKMQAFLKQPKNIFLVAGSILLFAAVITVIEFPCSALVPVTYAGLLAQSQLSDLAYVWHIALYVLFYLIDEIIVFLAAVFTMNLWLTSKKFTTWATLAEALILFLLGFYYLFVF